MMGLLLIAAAAIGYWAWKTKAGQALRIGDVAAVVAAIVGLRLLEGRSPPMGLAALAGAGWWLWFRKRGGSTEPQMTAERARRLLDVSPRASVEDIRAAHRRLAARVHPDAGGSTHLAAEINAARDILLATDVKR